MTVIRKPADDVETWMNIQGRKKKHTVRISLWVFCVCVCVYLYRLYERCRVWAASDQLCYGIIFITDLRRGALQLLDAKCTAEHGTVNSHLLFFFLKYTQYM